MLNVVDVLKFPSYMYVTVEGESPERVSSPEARKLAYEVRLQHGFENAGIEAIGGPYNVDSNEKEGEVQAIKPLDDALRISAANDATQQVTCLSYRQQYKIVRSLF